MFFKSISEVNEFIKQYPRCPNCGSRSLISVPSGTCPEGESGPYFHYSSDGIFCTKCMLEVFQKEGFLDLLNNDAWQKHLKNIGAFEDEPIVCKNEQFVLSL